VEASLRYSLTQHKEYPAELIMELNMHNQCPPSGRNQGIRPAALQPHYRRLIHGRSLPRLVCLGMLVSSLLIIGFKIQAQELSKEQAKEVKHESGFLGDYYSRLQPDPKNSDLLVYWKNEDVLTKSNKFILDPVIVYLLPEAQQRGIDPEQLAMLAQYFTKAIKDQLTKSGSYQIVAQPGPRVLVLRLAITDVEPTGGKENAALKGAETAATHAVAPGSSLLIPRLSVGKVSIEGEMVDPVSGDVMVAFMSSKGGRRYFSGLKAYEKWGDIDAAFQSWAKNFRERLDKAHES
jgi:hypothetical protein